MFLFPRKIPIWVFIALILSNKNHFYYPWVIKICLLSREEHCRWPNVLFNKTHSHMLRLTLNRWPTVLFNKTHSHLLRLTLNRWPTVLSNKTHSHLLRLTRSGRPSRANCANLRTTPLLYPNTPELVDYLYLFGGFCMVQSQPSLFKDYLFISQSIKTN